MDQLVFYVPYFKNEEPVERFFSYISIEAHTLKHLKNAVVYFEAANHMIMRKNFECLWRLTCRNYTEINELSIFATYVARS